MTDDGENEFVTDDGEHECYKASSCRYTVIHTLRTGSMANRYDWVSLSAALRAGTGAEERVAAGLLAAGQVWWWGSGQGGVVR